MGNALTVPVSVLMSIYRREKPLRLEASLRSLALQSHAATEIVLVEDGAIGPELRAVIDDFSATLPIKSIRLASNIGLAGALNAGLEHCRHELVARMDTDDVALPERLERQVAFMAANPDISVSSAWVAEKDEAMATTIFIKKLPLEHAEIAAFAKRRNPINHPVCIFRKQAVLAAGGYPTVFPEDYALWSLMLMRGDRFANLPLVLLDMRTGEEFIERRGLGFLRREISLVKFQRSIGFFNWREAAVFFAVRAAVRLPPPPIRKLIYRYSR